jgi:hypothetical protein
MNRRLNHENGVRRSLRSNEQTLFSVAVVEREPSGLETSICGGDDG